MWNSNFPFDVPRLRCACGGVRCIVAHRACGMVVLLCTDGAGEVGAFCHGARLQNGLVLVRPAPRSQSCWDAESGVVLCASVKLE